MLSRRDFFRASAVATAAVAVVATGAGGTLPAHAMTHSSVTDMTHTLTEDFPTFFGKQQFFQTQVFNYTEHKFNLKELRVNEHTGTHIDSPLHFSADGTSVDLIPVDKLVVPLAVIDLREKAAANADAEVTPDDIKAWIAANGPLPPGCCLALNSGWAQHLGTPKFRNADADGKMHFPGFHAEAAKMLIEEADVSGVASDTLSLDIGASPDFAFHYAWLPSNRWGIECLANLDAVPATGGTLVVGAPKHAGGTGGPARVFTLV